MTCIVDDPGKTIRAQYRNPAKFICANWKPLARRNERIWGELYMSNRSCPVVGPYQAFRRS